MELVIKHFTELTADELFEIYKLRCTVFIVEQTCIYQDVDDFDRIAYHLWLRDEEGIQAYSRVLPQGATFPEASLGRVIAVKRRCGLGTRIVEAAIKTARDMFNADILTIEAQVYARSLYEKLGFIQSSEEFVEDGIPHIQMQLEI